MMFLNKMRMLVVFTGSIGLAEALFPVDRRLPPTPAGSEDATSTADPEDVSENAKPEPPSAPEGTAGSEYSKSTAHAKPESASAPEDTGTWMCYICQEDFPKEWRPAYRPCDPTKTCKCMADGTTGSICLEKRCWPTYGCKFGECPSCKEQIAYSGGAVPIYGVFCLDGTPRCERETQRRVIPPRFRAISVHESVVLLFSPSSEISTSRDVYYIDGTLTLHMGPASVQGIDKAVLGVRRGIDVQRPEIARLIAAFTTSTTTSTLQVKVEMRLVKTSSGWRAQLAPSGENYDTPRAQALTAAAGLCGEKEPGMWFTAVSVGEKTKDPSEEQRGGTISLERSKKPLSPELLTQLGLAQLGMSEGEDAEVKQVQFSSNAPDDAGSTCDMSSMLENVKEGNAIVWPVSRWNEEQINKWFREFTEKP